MNYGAPIRSVEGRSEHEYHRQNQNDGTQKRVHKRIGSRVQKDVHLVVYVEKVLDVVF